MNNKDIVRGSSNNNSTTTVKEDTAARNYLVPYTLTKPKYEREPSIDNRDDFEQE